MLFAFLLKPRISICAGFGKCPGKNCAFCQSGDCVHSFTGIILSEARAHEFAHDAAEGLIKLRSEPKSMLMPLFLALTNKTALIIILTLVFLAFKVPISIGTIIACFSIGYLFVIISPTPAGIGVVEGALTLALTSMYISLEDAAVITLSYRGITFWIPLLFGMISLRVLEKVGIKPNSNNNHTEIDV